MAVRMLISDVVELACRRVLSVPVCRRTAFCAYTVPRSGGPARCVFCGRYDPETRDPDS